MPSCADLGKVGSVPRPVHIGAPTVTDHKWSLAPYDPDTDEAPEGAEDECHGADEDDEDDT
jgi:hypothetical protein